MWYFIAFLAGSVLCGIVAWVVWRNSEKINPLSGYSREQAEKERDRITGYAESERDRLKEESERATDRINEFFDE